MVIECFNNPKGSVDMKDMQMSETIQLKEIIGKMIGQSLKCLSLLWELETL